MKGAYFYRGSAVIFIFLLSEIFEKEREVQQLRICRLGPKQIYIVSPAGAITFFYIYDTIFQGPAV